MTAKERKNTASIDLSFTHDIAVLREINKHDELDSVVALVVTTLKETNEAVGKALYSLDVALERTYLDGVSHLLGAFLRDTDALVGVIAIEEDAIERIIVQKPFQCQGIGAEMMRAVRILLGAEYVDVFTDNKRALKFFEMQGMAMFDETAPEPGDLSAKSPYGITHLMY